MIAGTAVLALIVVHLGFYFEDSLSLLTGHKTLLEATIKQGVDSADVAEADFLASPTSPSSVSRLEPLLGSPSSGSYAGLPQTLDDEPPPVLFYGGVRVRPLHSMPVDGRTTQNPELQWPGFHQIRAVDSKAYGVVKVPWALEKATTALAEWYLCVRTVQHFDGLAHRDGTLVTPCIGQMKELALLPPPKLTPCDPFSAGGCADQRVHIPPGECAHSYLGCIRDSIADQRWNTWFQQVFLPAFAKYSRTRLRPGEGVADADILNKGYHVISTCHHVLLTYAPWCRLRTSQFNDWMLNLDTGLPPGRNSTPILPELKRKLYVTLSLDRKEPVLKESMIPLSPERRALSATLGSEVYNSAQTAPLVSRRAMLQQVAKYFRSVSTCGRLNEHDAQAIERLKWRAWPAAGGALPNFDPVNDLGPNSTGYVNEDNVTDAELAAAPTLFHASDFPNETLDESPEFGSVYLRRVRSRYPVILAVRRDDDRLRTAKRPTRNLMYDYNHRVIGFHVCIVGALRNFSSTVRMIRRRYLDTLRPQRIHVVTSDHGHKDYYKDLDESMTKAEKKAAARAALMNRYAALVPFAATLLVVPNGMTMKNECLNCRGAFMKELARMSLLSDLARSYVVELVFVFRPDLFPWMPLYLTPFFPESREMSVLGSHFGYMPRDRGSSHTYTAPADGPSDDPSVVQDADVLQYRLNASDYHYTLGRDRGFMPTHFGYINDINITKFSIVFHTRVSLGLDNAWIGDAMLLGHWTVVNHWLMHFSTTLGSATDLWEDLQSGEKHQARFADRYIMPMFKLAVEAGVSTHHVHIRNFDFMFSLYRTSQAINNNLFALHVSYAAFQEMTIVRDYPTKYQESLCKHYRFSPINVNLTQEYGKNTMLAFHGSIGRIVYSPMPMEACRRAPTPPALPTCYPPFVRVPLSSRNAFKAPCAPFCGHINLLAVEGICLFTGKTGKHPRTFGKPNTATYSESPQTRSYAGGEVARFNVVFPQSVRRRKPSDLIP